MLLRREEHGHEHPERLSNYEILDVAQQDGA